MINIWSDNVQEYFMGSVRKIIHAYGVGIKKYENNKKNKNPDNCLIQEIKGTTRTVIDCSGSPSWF